MDAEIHSRVPECSLPQGLNAHPVFYTVPLELLEAVVDRVGEQHFDPALLDLDRTLSRLNGDHSGYIGFRRSQPISYRLLGDPLGVTAMLRETDFKDLGWPESFRENPSLSKLEERLGWIRSVSRAYAGWLSMDAGYITEQQLLMEQRAADAAGCVEAPVVDAASTNAFLERWHLESVAGPFLPEPVEPQLPLLMPAGQQQQLSGLGEFLFLPTIFPLPDRDMLHEMLEDASARHDPPAHLRGWIEVARNNSEARKSLSRFARIFLLQHFWRVIYSRHAHSLQGRQAQLRMAFASFLFPKANEHELDKKAEVLRKDLSELSAARGGPDWFLRPIPEDAFF